MVYAASSPTIVYMGLFSQTDNILMKLACLIKTSQEECFQKYLDLLLSVALLRYRAKVVFF